MLELAIMQTVATRGAAMASCSSSLGGSRIQSRVVRADALSSVRSTARNGLRLVANNNTVMKASRSRVLVKAVADVSAEDRGTLDMIGRRFHSSLTNTSFLRGIDRLSHK